MWVSRQNEQGRMSGRDVDDNIVLLQPHDESGLKILSGINRQRDRALV